MAVQGSETYSIFLYQCDLIKWTLHNAVVGFNMNEGFYENHKLSKSEDVVNIDCPDDSLGNFTKVVYKIGNGEKNNRELIYVIESCINNFSYVKCIFLTIVCNANTSTTDYGTFHWPTTIPGNTATLSCPNGPTGANATRKCSENSMWESPNLLSCLTHTGPIQVFMP